MLYVRIVFVADHRLGSSGGVRWSREVSQVVLWAILSPASKYVLVSKLDNYNNRVSSFSAVRYGKRVIIIISAYYINIILFVENTTFAAADIGHLSGSCSDGRGGGWIGRLRWLAARHNEPFETRMAVWFDDIGLKSSKRFAKVIRLPTQCRGGRLIWFHRSTTGRRAGAHREISLPAPRPGFREIISKTYKPVLPRWQGRL